MFCWFLLYRKMIPLCICIHSFLYSFPLWFFETAMCVFTGLPEVLAAAPRVSSASDGLLHCGTWTPVGGLWRARAQLLWHPGSAAPWDVGISSRPGIEPGPPALQGRFSTTGPPGKSLLYGLSWDIESSSLYYTAGPYCSSILYIIVRTC